MLHFSVSTGILALLSISNLGAALPATVVTQSSLRPSYDFIVIGAGTSGSIVAARLSENTKHTVLVIESGPLLEGKQEFDDVLVLPKPEVFAQYGVRGGSVHQWANHTTGPVESLGNRTINLNIARIVGGGSALNGRIWARGSARDYNDWASLLSSPTWSWSSLLPYFKKSETFHPPSESVRIAGNITWDISSHGTSGPLSVSQPGYLYKSTKELIAAERAMGIKQVRDQAAGEPVGGYWFPSTQELTGERSYTKTGYLDPLRGRGNLHLLVDRTVTKIVFEGKRAVGVEYASASDSPRFTVLASKEVIVAAGAIKGPQLLQVSGIGPQKLLKSLKVPVLSDLPVGENLQDHGTLIMNFTTTLPDEEQWREARNLTFLQQQYSQYLSNRTGIYTAYSNNRIALLPLPSLLPSTYKQLITRLSSEPQHKYLSQDAHPAFKTFYAKSIRKTYDSFLTDKVAALELYNNNKYLIPIRPSSRGHVFARSLSMFDAPRIDHRTLTHPLDIEIMLAGIRFVRKFFQQPELGSWEPREGNPHRGVEDDEGLLGVLRGSMSSGTAHMCCTAPMGAVLDARMRVIGVKGLRVVDASSWPLLPGAHTTYCTAVAVAEKAAESIKEDYAERESG